MQFGFFFFFSIANTNLYFIFHVPNFRVVLMDYFCALREKYGFLPLGKETNNFSGRLQSFKKRFFRLKEKVNFENTSAVSHTPIARRLILFYSKTLFSPRCLLWALYLQTENITQLFGVPKLTIIEERAQLEGLR
jgi:hypothetical protein